MMESFNDAAGIRYKGDVAQAALGGADTATIPSKLLHQMVARARRSGPTERSLRWASHRGAPRSSAGD
jgi:transaldolase